MTYLIAVRFLLYSQHPTNQHKPDKPSSQEIILEVMVSLAAGDGNEAADEETAKASKTPYCDWIFSLDQDWLLNVILPWLGAEELLLRSCDVCPIWRQW